MTVPKLILASSLSRWITATPGESVAERTFDFSGHTVRECLHCLFELHPQLRSYILDETGTIRHHVVAYVQNEAIDKSDLNHALQPQDEVFIFQALSGG